MRQRAAQIRRAPELHKPRLVTSDHVRGTSLLDRIADAVNLFCGAETTDKILAIVGSGDAAS